MDLVPTIPKLLTRIRKLFDVDARPDVIAAHLGADSRLAHSVGAAPGLRVPGAIDEFELVIRAILGQRISVKAATTVAGRLAAKFGERIETPFANLNRLPPTAKRLARVTKSELAALGIAESRAVYIQAVSKAFHRGDLCLENGVDPDLVIQRLRELPGIGEWTAQYVAMRALHWPDAFPFGDLVLCKASGGQTPSAMRNMADRWRPWRAYAAAHLWNSTTLNCQEKNQ
jgi:AraC family transcriptional regulator of adaptative response / DNA-3-methyladenine glycosylase II